jgi:hypothetical protein
MGVVMLEKHFFKFLVIYCLIKSFNAFKRFKEQLNKGNPFLILFPFWEILPNLITS